MSDIGRNPGPSALEIVDAPEKSMGITDGRSDPIRDWRSRYDRGQARTECRRMVKHFDHCTIVVRDVDRAKKFFGLLGFKEAMSVVIAGEPFASYMGVPGIEADHVTLVLENASPRTEIQLLRYR